MGRRRRDCGTHRADAVDVAEAADARVAASSEAARRQGRQQQQQQQHGTSKHGTCQSAYVDRQDGAGYITPSTRADGCCSRPTCASGTLPCASSAVRLPHGQGPRALAASARRVPRREVPGPSRRGARRAPRRRPPGPAYSYPGCHVAVLPTGRTWGEEAGASRSSGGVQARDVRLRASDGRPRSRTTATRAGRLSWRQRRRPRRPEEVARRGRGRVRVLWRVAAGGGERDSDEPAPSGMRIARPSSSKGAWPAGAHDAWPRALVTWTRATRAGSKLKGRAARRAARASGSPRRSPPTDARRPAHVGVGRGAQAGAVRDARTHRRGASRRVHGQAEQRARRALPGLPDHLRAARAARLARPEEGGGGAAESVGGDAHPGAAPRQAAAPQAAQGEGGAVGGRHPGARARPRGGARRRRRPTPMRRSSCASGRRSPSGARALRRAARAAGAAGGEGRPVRWRRRRRS